jgi:hypothetical protein
MMMTMRRTRKKKRQMMMMMSKLIGSIGVVNVNNLSIMDVGG